MGTFNTCLIVKESLHFGDVKSLTKKEKQCLISMVRSDYLKETKAQKNTFSIVRWRINGKFKEINHMGLAAINVCVKTKDIQSECD